MKKIIVYDFDGTLTPYPITNFGILESCGFVGGGNNKDFKKIVSERMKEKNIDVYNAFYEIIFEVVISNGYKLCDDVFSLGSKSIEYNKGIEEYFNYLNNYDIDNYVISSSIKCFLDNTKYAKYFEKVYATTFKYNNKEIIGIDCLMTDEKKIDAIKEIMDSNNLYDCSNIIYIGDGLTDLPIMEYVINNGGKTIFVYDNELDLDDIKNSKIVSYFYKKDYSLDGDIFRTIKDFFNLE